MSDLNTCLCEILTDENGNEITPECGIERLLQKMVNAIDSLSTSGGVTEIDGGYPDNDT